MAYARAEDARAYGIAYAKNRTEDQKKRRRAGDRARYRARQALETQHKGDYLRHYAREYAKAEKELGL